MKRRRRRGRLKKRREEEEIEEKGEEEEEEEEEEVEEVDVSAVVVCVREVALSLTFMAGTRVSIAPIMGFSLPICRQVVALYGIIDEQVKLEDTCFPACTYMSTSV